LEAQDEEGELSKESVAEFKINGKQLNIKKYDDDTLHCVGVHMSLSLLQ